MWNEFKEEHFVMFVHICKTTVVLTHLFPSRYGYRVMFESVKKSNGSTGPSLRSRRLKKIRLTSAVMVQVVVTKRSYQVLKPMFA